MYTNWAMNIGESSEACLFVTARVPKLALDGALLHLICNEIVEEINNLDQELRDKFRYEIDPSSVIRTNSPPPVDAMKFGPVQEGLPQHKRYRLPGR
jgi:hypothetical protein